MIMNTETYQEFKPANSKEVYFMYDEVKDMSKKISCLKDDLDQMFLRRRLTEVIEENYDFGKVTQIFEIFGGYVNRSFGIRVEKDGEVKPIFVRQYKKGVQEKEIMFEHKLILHAKEHGLDIAADPIAAKDGKTFVKVVNPIASDCGEEDLEYYGVYTFLAGEDPYTWITPYCTDKEFTAMGEVLATFHDSAKDFDPAGLARVELEILDFVETLPGIFTEYAATEGVDNIYHEFFNKNLDAYNNHLAKNKIEKMSPDKMLYTATHNDYHPGNVKFIDEEIVGIFDFDWSKIELRLFDICLGVVYTCVYWEADEAEKEDTLRLDKARLFFKGYEDKLQELGGLPGFTKEEKGAIKNMLALANIYLVHWCAEAYYGDVEGLNEYEYLAYLKHQTKVMHWIENNEDAINEMANNL